jgi:uncharacterized surface protein with fasciclin (FAS1) repeats
MMTFDFNKPLLATLALACFSSITVSAEDSCKTIVELACETEGLSTLCDLASTSDYVVDTLANAELTVFAPTDDAFAAVDPELLDSLANCTVALESVLFFHATSDRVYVDDLECGETVIMANGDSSRTVCVGGSSFVGANFYQKGSLNPRDTMPEIILADIEACNGVVHVVDQVMLPKLKSIPFELCGSDETEADPVTTAPVEATAAPVEATAAPVEAESVVIPEPFCESIADIACNSVDFTTLCDLLQQFALDEALSGGTWTVFAPVDDAFAAIEEVAAELTEEQLLDILLYHVVAEQAVTSDMLECKGLTVMASGQNSRTKCGKDEFGVESIFQRGPGQIEGMLPKVILPNLEACNGVIHVVDNVMIPRL